MQHLTLIRDSGKLEDTLREKLKGFFPKGASIAVKLHMGEIGNKFYLKPGIINRIVSVLKEIGLKPFLFDSVVLYSGARDTKEKYNKTAEKHGFTEESIGCPVVISDIGINVKTEDAMIHVCKELAEADGMLVASHVKGHCCYGFGGAIKNIGMGGVTPKSKETIHMGKEAPTDKLLAEGAAAVLSKTGRAFYLNFLVNITRECDCCNDAGPVVADDIGILFGKDIVAIDKASVDLIYEQKPGVFDKLHKKDPYLQIKYAKELGLGEEEYDIS